MILKYVDISGNVEEIAQNDSEEKLKEVARRHCDLDTLLIWQTNPEGKAYDQLDSDSDECRALHEDGSYYAIENL